MYEDLAKELKKNIEILHNMFEVNNLQILNLSVRPEGEDDADCNILLEIASIEGNSIPCDLLIKINLYDEDDEIYMTNSEFVLKDKFSGYDTFSIYCFDNSNTLLKAVKGRLFITKL